MVVLFIMVKFTKDNMANKCGCPIYCRFCGAKLKKDNIGHYCPTSNCQNQYGVDGCTEEEIKERKLKDKG